MGFGLRLGFGFRLYFLSVGFFKFFKGLGLFLAWGEGFFDFSLGSGLKVFGLG